MNTNTKKSLRLVWFIRACAVWLVFAMLSACDTDRYGCRHSYPQSCTVKINEVNFWLHICFPPVRIQKHKRLKVMLFIRTKNNLRIFGAIPFNKLKTYTETKNDEKWDGELIHFFAVVVVKQCPLLGRFFPPSLMNTNVGHMFKSLLLCWYNINQDFVKILPFAVFTSWHATIEYLRQLRSSVCSSWWYMLNCSSWEWN